MFSAPILQIVYVQEKITTWKSKKSRGTLPLSLPEWVHHTGKAPGLDDA